MNQIKKISTLILVLVGFFHGPADGKTYYLSPQGTDRSDCTGGTRENPWRTWRSIVNNECICAGDTVYLMAGTYSAGTDFFHGSESDYLIFHGTSEEPIVLSADPEALGEWPVKLVGGLDLSGNGGVLLGLEVYGNGGQPIVVHGSHFTIQECYVHGRPEDVDVDGSKIVVYDCIKILAGNTEQYHDIQVIDNTICDCAEDAIDVTGARNILYRGNHIYNARFMQVKGGTENIVIENNRIHKMHTGIIGWPMGGTRFFGNKKIPTFPVEERYAAQNVTIRNNLIYDIRHNESIGARGWQNVQIYHNTIYQRNGHPVLELGKTGFNFFDELSLEYCETHSCQSCGDGCVRISFPAKDVHFKNNILHTLEEHVLIAHPEAVSGFVSESNIWYNPAGQVLFSVGDHTYDIDSFPYESGSYITDPGLSDPGSGDFSLISGSFAVDRATQTNVDIDFRGYYRDGQPDIGAWESDGVPPGGESRVNMTILTDEEYLVAYDSVEIRVETLNMEGMTEKVSLFANDSSISELHSEPWKFYWTPGKAGNYEVFARAVDTAGQTVDSRHYQVETLPSYPPQVRITSPVSGSEYEYGANIGISVEASDPDGTIQMVEILIDDNMVWEDSSDLFFFDWKDVEDGDYTIKASATDNTSQKVWSDPIHLVVHENPFTFLYLEDFNDGLAQDWANLSGIWQVKDSLFQVTDPSDAGISLYNKYILRDIRFTSKILFDENDYVGMVFNYQDPENFYSVGIMKSPPIAVLRKTLDGSMSKIAQIYYPSVESGSWQELLLTNREGRTSFAVNDCTLFQNLSTPDLMEGRIGFFTENIQASFNDVEVAAKTAALFTGLNATSTTTSEGLTVIPNPVCEKEFVVYALNGGSEKTIEIYDMYGRRVHQCLMRGSRTQISSDVLGAPGIYLLKTPYARTLILHTPHRN